ncbi:MAG: redox-regulated ATPase YchF [Candidatus Buchananbacteria bacterium RIFCSPHIGHO2_01_FULL_39_14]|uniref:Ribosome-binding ATPase YchF n=2 Tax=Candidatus Buchananiibacteriota TaxID=1817903 RepID=A0A1G1YU70_9BACT|nr:MAG: redox-regulated ATPase YchF [Candidatus Buchananbacteria bacterium RIFCSPHIGHO2_01_FULL_39_14]OGY49170.1 MAG: redox-regulated ATPase YchF [Candidatus Buchananbacteria bacterium RIFCSPHIGHO2_02_FULL_39_17]OGY55903.1 MAG: redox-regulated ATPase YchF [Candidatus Buchananbacteria bacterium RIFCSPLOWO2_01_FULL_40_23b]
MSFSIGIVGLPNVGKSTLFKALTKKQVDASNYPFCTIDPNVGVVAVPDERIEKLAKMSKSEKTIYTTVEFVDIAGLVKNAHQGEGLGNKFLSHIREVDAIIHLLREFSDANVIHVDGKVNPASDRETINLELIFADLQTLEKRLVKNQKDLHANLKEAKELEPTLQKLKTGLEAGKLAKEIITNEKEKLLIRDLNLLTIKPMIDVFNIDENKISDQRSAQSYLQISAKIEAELADLSPIEAKDYLKQLGLNESGLDKIIKEAYRILDLVSFLTTGPKESRAWTVAKGTKAPQAAGVIHTDFEKNFVKAEVINWQDLLNCGSEVAAKEKGLIRIEGKDYVMKDGDVVVFKVGV